MKKLTASKIYFGKTARNYDKIRVRSQVTHEDDLAIRKFINRIESKSILVDLPCGTGRVLPLLTDQEIIYIGADVSGDMVRISKEKALTNPNASFLVCDAREIPLHEKFSDYLISVKFIKWLPNDEIVEQVLREFRRVCKKKAFINVKVQPKHVKKDFNEVKDRIKDIYDLLRYRTNARAMDERTFEYLCMKSGWKIVEKSPNSMSNGFVINYILE